MPGQIQRRTFSVDEYYRMAKAGILWEDEHVELIGGEIIQMPPIGSSHASHVDRLTRVFTRTFAETVIVRVQNPVHIDDRSEPEPDITLLKLRPDFYAESHPIPEEVLLLVEVADTSLEYDREIKLPLYAKRGIKEVWIVNLRGNCLEVYTEPDGEGYEVCRTFRKGKTIISKTFPELTISVDEILG